MQAENQNIREFIEKAKTQLQKRRELTEQQYRELMSSDPSLSLEMSDYQQGHFSGRIFTWEAALSVLETLEAEL